MNFRYLTYNKNLSFSERFWAKVDISPEDKCWEWLGAKSRGYGYTRDSHRNYRGSHRVAYELTYGPIPNGMLVCHRCDNPLCCNPAHLFLGTNQDNTSDMLAKGRFHNTPSPGERNGNAKLTLEQVREIRRLATTGERTSNISSQFGVAMTTIRRITSGRYWRQVD
jgi:hypothetical protein